MTCLIFIFSNNYGSYEIVLNTFKEGDTTFNRGSIVRSTGFGFIPASDTIADYLQEAIYRLNSLAIQPYKQIKATVIALTTKLLSDKIDEREQEQINMELERLLNDLLHSQEYLKELENVHANWMRDNETLNKKAYESILAELLSMDPTALSELLKTKSELSWVLKNEGDNNAFHSFSTRNLSLSEVRAIYHATPADYYWKDYFEERINILTKWKPDNEREKKNIKKKVKTEVKRDKNNLQLRDCFEELLRKRKKKDYKE